MQMEIQSIPETISIRGDEIRAQRITMAKLTEQLKRPLHQREKHLHYLRKPMLFCIFLVISIVGLCVWIGQLYEYIHEKKMFLCIMG